MHTQQHPNGARIVADFETWATTADADQVPRDLGRERAWMEIRAKSPKRSTQPQQDVNDCPLFIAANEPNLL